MTKLVDVLNKALNEPPFLADLVTNPRGALYSNKFELSEEDTKKLEMFVLSNQRSLFATFEMFGISTGPMVADSSKWGIGASCCNVKPQ